MIETEITQAKQCALTTRDWDTYQVIVRTCLTPHKSYPCQPDAVKQSAGQTPEADNVLLRWKRA
jgi:hypothetical protein